MLKNSRPCLTKAVLLTVFFFFIPEKKIKGIKSTDRLFISSLIKEHKKNAGNQTESIPFNWIVERIVDKGYICKSPNKNCFEKKVFDTILPLYDVSYFARR